LKQVEIIKQTSKEGIKVRIGDPMQKPLRIGDCPREEQMFRDLKGYPTSSETQSWA